MNPEPIPTRTNDQNAPPNQIGKVPKGSNLGKMSLGDIILQGLIGAK